MDQRRRGVPCGKLLLQSELAGLERHQLPFQRAQRRIILGDQTDDPADPAFYTIELAALGLCLGVFVRAQPVDLAVKLFAEDLERLRRHQPVAKDLGALGVDDAGPEAVRRVGGDRGDRHLLPVESLRVELLAVEPECQLEAAAQVLSRKI